MSVSISVPSAPVRGRRRRNNRSEQLLDAAAELFSEQGFHVTSMRDVAHRAQMLPGSIYYHFASKEELLLAVYEEGVRRIALQVDGAVADKGDPWDRLEAACIAHVEALLAPSHYAQLVIRIRPEEAPAVAHLLARLRDQYEQRFREVINGLELADGVSRAYLRLMLLGAMNWSQIWYQPGGDSPRRIAEQFVQLVRPLRRHLDTER